MPDPIAPPAAQQPAEATDLVCLALSDGDLEAALAQYEPGAALRPWAVDAAPGADGLRAILARVIDLRLPLSTDAFLSKAGGQFIKIAYPGAAMTQAFGINDRDEVVGAYTIGTGSKAKMYGFTWQPGHGFTTVSDPKGLGSTVINGVNNAGDLAGFYTGSKGNTGGMLALPSH